MNAHARRSGTRRAIGPRLRTWSRLAGLTAIATTGLTVGVSGIAGATTTAPSTISAVSATPGQASVQLSWIVPANGGAAITGFLVKAFQGANLIGSSVVPAGVVGSDLDPTPGASDDFTGSAPGGTPYSFRVAAVNSIGTAPDSPNTNVIIASSTPTSPYVPRHVSGTSSANFLVTITWTVPQNNGSAIEDFAFVAVGTTVSPIVPVGAVGSALDPTPGAIDHYTLTNLPPGSYALEMNAGNAFGPGPSAVLGNNPITVFGPVLSVTKSPGDFGDATLGDYVGPQSVTLTNTGNATDTITDFTTSGVGADDYFGTDCTTIAAGASCTFSVNFDPGKLGGRPSTLTIEDGSLQPTEISLFGAGTIGYYQAGAFGEVGTFGDAAFYGDATDLNLNRPIVSITPTGNNGGYWLTATDGGIFAFGDAQFYGSTGAIHLNKPIVGMAVTPDDGGYWMVASDGGIFAFGDAPFYGSTGSIHLNKPIVGMATTPDGGGYWLVASDGGIFSFGDASFYGSTGAITLNKPIVGMAGVPDGGGYWLVASDGGIFTFGDAPFDGSTGGLPLASPILGVSPMPDGSGYWLTNAIGDIFSFGGAPFLGSVGSLGVNDVIGVATNGRPTQQAIFDVPASKHHSLTPSGSTPAGSPAHDAAPASATTGRATWGKAHHTTP